MATYTALTTLDSEAAAQALATSMEALHPAPTGIGVLEIEDGSGRREVGGYFVEPPDQAGLALLAVIHGARPFAVSRVEDRDWVAQVRRELTPVEGGRFILYGGHDEDRIGVNRWGLRIEAAMAFGTGHHGTTRGCLLLLERLIRRGEKARKVADIGCGTGVLAMAAARVWRVPCIATDIDPVASWTASENVRANRLQPWVHAGQAVGFRSDLVRSRAPYDLIFANILAAPLKRMAPEVARHLAPGGVAILSGLLRSQTRGVEAVYAGHGLRREDRVELGEWASLLMRKRGGQAERKLHGYGFCHGR
jgi:ribosomal protein L11 methyltransferase